MPEIPLCYPEQRVQHRADIYILKYGLEDIPPLNIQ